ncbi:MAG: glycosyltransferase [ANME-2 cluster archaeon]|nr:MAG: glycosyltransferase [ANME-2 cluster archaeon]
MKKSNSTALIIFQKNFFLGKVKTRLAKTIGDVKALEVFKKLVEKTYDQIPTDLLDVHIYFGSAIEKINHPLHERASFHIQTEDDLGARMVSAFESTFKLGYEKVLIIGTDCPFIIADIYQKAIEILDDKDYVIGPANDGVYYLLGAKDSPKDIMKNIAWSTDTVLKSTLQSIEKEGKSYCLLEALTDIDDAEDFKEFEEIFAKE